MLTTTKNDTDNAREIFQQMKMLIGKRVEKKGWREIPGAI
jgi:hypothetical protein